MHCLEEIYIKKDNTERSLRHLCAACSRKTEYGPLLGVMSNLFYVQEWCPDKVNCKSCIQIVQREDPQIKGDNMRLRDRQRMVLCSFDFNSEKIVCVHCRKEQKLQSDSRTAFNSHKCSTGKI